MTARIGALAFVAMLSASAFACQQPGDTNQNSQGVANKQAQEPQGQPPDNTPTAQSEAEQKMAAARADFDKTREGYRHDKQLDLDNLNQKITDLDANEKTATGKRKTELDAQLPNIHAQRDSFVNDLKIIQYATPASWDATKARLDREWKALDDAVKDAP